MKRQASSQASWSLLAEGVTSARVQAHRVRASVIQLQNAIKGTPLEEEIQRLCGDVLLAIPRAAEIIERDLDRTNYALIKLGEGFYRSRLPIEDREIVEISSKFNPYPSPKKVASKYLNSKR